MPTAEEIRVGVGINSLTGKQPMCRHQPNGRGVLCFCIGNDWRASNELEIRNSIFLSHHSMECYMRSHRRISLIEFADHLDYFLWSHAGEFGENPGRRMRPLETCLYELSQSSLLLIDSLLDDDTRRGPRPQLIPRPIGFRRRFHATNDPRWWHEAEAHEGEEYRGEVEEAVEAETESDGSEGFWTRVSQTDTDENEGVESFSDSAASGQKKAGGDAVTPWPPTPSFSVQAVDAGQKSGYEVNLFDDPLSVPDTLFSHRKRSSP